MGTYDEIYRVIDGLFLDKKEHSIQEIRTLCEQQGILLSDRNAVNNVVHKLKVRNRRKADKSRQRKQRFQAYRQAKRRTASTGTAFSFWSRRAGKPWKSVLQSTRKARSASTAISRKRSPAAS